jgi:serine/threonine-protein kinase
MGVVYLATDTTLQRPVAIKVVHPDLAVHPTIIERFLAEARMIAGLRHPNIVTVHAAGEAIGLFYYVMGYVPGESLRQRLQREPGLDLAMAMRIVADLAGALDAAGRAGLVHRDVKPENILLDHSTGRALLADFGIARSTVDETLDPPARGLAVGTPTYMSPEQAAGEPVDRRSDLYSLGLVAYEMLAGQPPFRGSNLEAVARQHLHGPLPPLHHLRPELPQDLNALIQRALERRPARRWQNGADFRRALLATMAGGSRPPRSGSRLRGWVVAAVAALALLWASFGLA